MDNEIRLDEELAAYTDALIDGRSMESSIPELTRIVDALHRMIEPQADPEPAFHTRLTNVLTKELEQQQRHQRVTRLRNQRLTRYGAIAAAIVVVLVGILLFTQGSGSQDLEGTAQGDGNLVFVGIGVAAALTIFYLWTRFRR